MDVAKDNTFDSVQKNDKYTHLCKFFENFKSESDSSLVLTQKT